MAGSSAALSAAELAFVTAGKPILVGTNALADVAGAPVWNNGVGGYYTGETDQSDEDFPPWWVYDGDLDEVTQPIAAQAPDISSGTDGVWRLVFQLRLAAEFDVAIVGGLNLGALGGSYTVTLQIADVADFVGAISIAQWAAVASDARLVSVALDDVSAPTGARRYTGYAYGRLIIRRVGFTGNFRPTVGEIVLGRRRQLQHSPRISGGYDDQSLVSKRTIVEGRTGARTGFVEYEGRRELRGTTVLNTDETTEVRAWFRECGYGTGHFAWIENASTPTTGCYWMDLEDSRLEAVLAGPLHREWTIEAVELPPFVSEEAA